MMKLANPAPVGLFGFALTTWLLSLHNADLIGGPALAVILPMAFAYGGTAQFVAGVLEMFKGNTFGFVAFCSYGAFWWTFALYVKFFAATGAPEAVGWYLLCWGVFSLAMWIATFALNRMLFLIFLVLTITFFLLAFGDLLGIKGLTVTGGYCGLLTALLAFYLAAAEVINDVNGRTVLPIGARA